MKKNFISIITPMYNGAAFISQTIKSVLAQTYINWEMIVIDDCSTDNKAGINIVKEFQKDNSNIKLIELDENKGTSGARNHGLRVAQGQYICMLDSDDLWQRVFLEEQKYLLDTKNCALVYSSFNRVDENNREILSPVIVKKIITYDDLLKINNIGCLTTMYNREKTGDLYFNEDLKNLCDDFAFWLVLLRKHKSAYGSERALASLRIHPNSVTFNKYKMIKPRWHVIREIEGLPLGKAIYYFINWAILAYLKNRK